jgi:predicted TIM-barrel fold metal-dependent hydrolase
MSTPIYSCDDHLDLYCMPPATWTERVAARQRELVPVAVESDGRLSWHHGSNYLGPCGFAGPYSAISRRTDVLDDGFRASRPEDRIADMDYDGIYASVVYGPTALVSLGSAGPAAEALSVSISNDWLYDRFNGHDPQRLTALASLPSLDGHAAACEVARCANLGFKGFTLNPFSAQLTDPAWEDVWSAIEESALPLSFHIGGGIRTVSARHGGWQVAAFAALLPAQLDEPLAVMLLGGALDRHPGLTLVLAEAGFGWLPGFVQRMDESYDKHHYGISPPLTMKPSELLQRQVRVTFEGDDVDRSFLERLGATAFMWASDYPHTDSTFTRSRECIVDLAHTTGDAHDLVVSQNCRQLYFPETLR